MGRNLDDHRAITEEDWSVPDDLPRLLGMPEVTGPRFRPTIDAIVLVRDNSSKLGHATDYLKNPISVFLEFRLRFEEIECYILIGLKTKAVFFFSYLMDFFFKLRKNREGIKLYFWANCRNNIFFKNMENVKLAFYFFQRMNFCTNKDRIMYKTSRINLG